MHVALGAQDADALAGEELLVGDAHELGDPAGGVVPALVAQDAYDGFVCQDAVANVGLGEPALIGNIAKKLMAVRSGLVHDDWNFREGQVGSQSCHGYNLWVQGVLELNGGLATGC